MQFRDRTFVDLPAATTELMDDNFVHANDSICLGIGQERQEEDKWDPFVDPADLIDAPGQTTSSMTFGGTGALTQTGTDRGDREADSQVWGYSFYFGRPGSFDGIPYDKNAVLPTQILITLLYTLRSAYCSEALQQELRIARGKCRALGKNMRSTFFAEASEILARVQRPIFQRFGLPDPPEGVFVLLNSVMAHENNSHVGKVGVQCRLLIGQDPREDETIADHVNAESVHAYAEENCRDWRRCIPDLPDAETMVAIKPSRSQGEGLFALQNFTVGQEIIRENPLAVLECGPTHHEFRDGALKLVNGRQIDKVLRSSLWRGLRSGQKATAYADLACGALGGHSHSRLENLAEALCVFGFNSFPAADFRARVLYKFICKANHSCSPNATVIVDAKRIGQLVCLKAIASGEEVTTSYLSGRELHMSQPERATCLYKDWEFVCGCPRCLLV